MREHQPAPEREPAGEPATAPAPRPAPSVAAALALQRTAGNAAVTAMLQRVPRPPASLRRDTSQLEVVPKPPAGPKMDYLEYVRNEPWDDEKMWAWTFRSANWNLLATWILFDAQDRVVHQDTEPPGNEVLPFAVVKRHVEKHGPAALGEWTMRLEKDEYYDDHRFQVTAEKEKPGAPMAGRTTPSYFNVRELPSTTARVLAKLEGAEVPIVADHKEQGDGETWFRVTFKAPMGELPAGTVGWVTAAALSLTASWDAFRAQLSEWEAQHMDLPLTLRIVRLRQMCHEKGLPFDRVIGRAPGREYLDTRPYRRGEWELLKDYQQVVMPDGRVVDVYHVLVGMDVLTRKQENRTIRWWGHLLNVGQNYSAATWSGDIGAAATDGWLRYDEKWEEQNPGASLDQRRRRYFDTRSSEADMLADVDAWGIDEMRSGPGAPDTIEGLLAAFYGAPQIGGPGKGGRHTSRRTRALERFLEGYGLTTTAPLRGQAARDGMAHQIHLFARVWLMSRRYFKSEEPELETEWVGPMTDMFLEWLQRLVKETGAFVPPGESEPAEASGP